MKMMAEQVAGLRATEVKVETIMVGKLETERRIRLMILLPTGLLTGLWIVTWFVISLAETVIELRVVRLNAVEVATELLAGRLTELPVDSLSYFQISNLKSWLA